VDQRWGQGPAYVELSYLWSEDRSVLVAAPPNTAVTFVQGPEPLVDLLLAAPGLRAREWSPHSAARASRG